jgi:hypothetical protein
MNADIINIGNTATLVDLTFDSHCDDIAITLPLVLKTTWARIEPVYANIQSPDDPADLRLESAEVTTRRGQ